MVRRTIKNRKELHIFIIAIISNKKETFTLAEIVEEVLENQLFNNFCSTIELAKKVSEAMDILLELGFIKGETEFPENSSEKFTVSYIT